MNQKSFIEIGIEKNYITISENEKKIEYKAQGKNYVFNDSEEKIRAMYYVELIENYGYTQDKINFEICVPKRTPNDWADIVIFEDEKQSIPYAVIECKRDEISDHEFNQAIEQVFGNANALRSKFAGVVAGNTRRFFDVAKYASMERQRNIIADIPLAFGKVQEFRYKKNDARWDIQPVNKERLIRTLEKCNDTLWAGGEMTPIDSFDELCKIIFLKIRDEIIPRKSGEPYEFQIKTYETSESVYNRITSLYADAIENALEVFDSKIRISHNKLVTIVNHLESINISKSDLDAKGVAFERFMEDFFKGKQGQFFTPREIVDFIIQISGVTRNSKVLDPACGSGGFLLHAFDYIRKQASEFAIEGTAEHKDYWNDFATKKLYGIEINQRIARVAKMNMIIHDDGQTNVICHDSLESFEKMTSFNKGMAKNSFDLILTNPPFGAIVKNNENSYLNDFCFGNREKSSGGKEKRKTQKSEILFIERCWEFLKAGTGKLTIILPDGVLTNTTLKYVRDFIQEKFEVLAIFSLPQVTFIHYGAGLKSSILFLRKRKESEVIVDNDVFCALINKVGYDATGRDDKNELPNIALKFKEFQKNNQKFHNSQEIFVKKISEFKRNRLDPYYYSPLFDEIIKKIKKSSYPLHRLESICLKLKVGKKETMGIFNGTTPAKEDYSENLSDPKIVKVASLKKGRVNLRLVENVVPKIVSNKVIKDGDILILSSAHQSEYLGRNPCIVNITNEFKHEEITFVGELINIRVNQQIVNPYYLLQLFNTRNYYLLINREKRGQTSHLYPSDIKNLLIPVPDDLEMQNKNACEYQKNYKKYEALVEQANNLLVENYDKFEKLFIPS
jgi:type I restriction enzyme M protein